MKIEVRVDEKGASHLEAPYEIYGIEINDFRECVKTINKWIKLVDLIHFIENLTLNDEVERSCVLGVSLQSQLEKSPLRVMHISFEPITTPGEKYLVVDKLQLAKTLLTEILHKYQNMPEVLVRIS